MRTFILVFVLLLSACAPEWQKPGATTDQLSTTQNQCQKQAEAQYPFAPHQVLVTRAYSTTNRGACFGSPNLVDCLNTRDIFVPPQFETVDDNKKPRDAAFKKCMSDKGWMPTD